tara:strand:- start:103 stop:330 length:228 start_codon:yes stop_codon:yes gene_type:complete
MAKQESELTPIQYNDKVWAEIKKLEDKVKELKLTLKPAELAKQASLNDCNKLARSAKVTPVKVDPKRLAEESSIK